MVCPADCSLPDVYSLVGRHGLWVVSWLIHVLSGVRLGLLLVSGGPGHGGVGEGGAVVVEGPTLGGVHGEDSRDHVQLRLSRVWSAPS